MSEGYDREEELRRRRVEERRPLGPDIDALLLFLLSKPNTRLQKSTVGQPDIK
jgi:hypothetical protein